MGRARQRYAQLTKVATPDSPGRTGPVHVDDAFDRLVALVQAVRFDHPDPARRKKLNELKHKYKGSKVETLCAQALNPDAPRKDPSHDASSMPSPTEEVWDEVFGGIDFDSMPPSIAEQVDAALAAGLDHENAGRYGKARQSYALAAGLDPGNLLASAHVPDPDRAIAISGRQEPAVGRNCLPPDRIGP